MRYLQKTSKNNMNRVLKNAAKRKNKKKHANYSRKREVESIQTFHNDVDAREAAYQAQLEKHIEPYCEETFKKEFLASGYSFSVFRHHFYLRCGKSSSFKDEKVEASMYITLKDNHLKIEDGILVESNK